MVNREKSGKKKLTLTAFLLSFRTNGKVTKKCPKKRTKYIIVGGGVEESRRKLYFITYIFITNNSVQVPSFLLFFDVIILSDTYPSLPMGSFNP
jgi:hypothetical protein